MTRRARESTITAAGREIGPHPHWTRLRLDKLNDLFKVDGLYNREKVIPEPFSTQEGTAGQDAYNILSIARRSFKATPESIHTAVLNQILLKVQSPIVTSILHTLSEGSLKYKETDKSYDE